MRLFSLLIKPLKMMSILTKPNKQHLHNKWNVFDFSYKNSSLRTNYTTSVSRTFMCKLMSLLKSIFLESTTSLWNLLKVLRYGVFYFNLDKSTSTVPTKKIQKVIKGNKKIKEVKSLLQMGKRNLRQSSLELLVREPSTNNFLIKERTTDIAFVEHWAT